MQPGQYRTLAVKLRSMFVEPHERFLQDLFRDSMVAGYGYDSAVQWGAVLFVQTLKGTVIALVQAFKPVPVLVHRILAGSFLKYTLKCTGRFNYEKTFRVE